PWMSLDGTDIIWSFTVHDDGARRAGTSVAGSSTQGLIRLIDGGPNNSRRGCIQGNNPNFQEMRSCSSSNVRSHRLFMASIGRSPGMWSPFEFTENRVLPITDKLYTYPIYDATSARYAEVSLEESVVGNYDLYLEMSEGVTQAGDYDKSVTPDVSGHFFVPQLNAGARFAEETFSDCNDRICPQNNFQDPSVPLFSGKTIYFNSDGAINVNANSSTGFQMLKDAKDLTLSIAVRPIRPFNTQEGSTAIYSDLLQKQDSFKVSLGENGKITTSIRVKMPDNSVKDLSSGFVGPDLPQGSWSHIAVTYSSTTHQMRTFIDSQLVHEIVLAESAGLNVNLASNFVIGPNKPGQSTLQLALDQVGVSRVVRTEDEIRRQAQLRLPHSTPSQERLPLGLKTKDLKNPSLLKAGLNCSKVILGRHLFFDPRLSADNKTSCATCHDPDQGFAEDMALHESRLASLGETSHLLRNTPGLFNLAFRSHFLRDGRARSLSEQARLVTSNPHEMGSDPEKIIAKLAASNQYKALFQKAFPESNNPFSTQNIFASLQEFDLTLLSAEFRFDQYMDGNISPHHERDHRDK
ncbi:MAG: hypothetical protein KDD35_09610, partial [Bdellovibrionales bacterium]|nr:hypothetical protein [Bdellovibrionales bacterium]